ASATATPTWPTPSGRRPTRSTSAPSNTWSSRRSGSTSTTCTTRASRAPRRRPRRRARASGPELAAQELREAGPALHHLPLQLGREREEGAARLGDHG